jgi:hypothetical protein
MLHLRLAWHIESAAAATCLGRLIGQPGEVSLAGVLSTPLALGLGKDALWVHLALERGEEGGAGWCRDFAGIIPRVESVGPNAGAERGLLGM